MTDFNLSNLINTLNNINIALAQLNKTLSTSFLQVGGTSSTATGGAATLPANPVGFVSITLPATGATVKIPYYST